MKNDRVCSSCQNLFCQQNRLFRLYYYVTIHMNEFELLILSIKSAIKSDSFQKLIQCISQSIFPNLKLSLFQAS